MALKMRLFFLNGYNLKYDSIGAFQDRLWHDPFCPVGKQCGILNLVKFRNTGPSDPKLQ